IALQLHLIVLSDGGRKWPYPQSDQDELRHRCDGPVQRRECDDRTSVDAHVEESGRLRRCWGDVLRYSGGYVELQQHLFPRNGRKVARRLETPPCPKGIRAE